MGMVFCGIDVGTRGARCLLVDEDGRLLAETEAGFEERAVPGLPDGWFEQAPQRWLDALCDAVGRAVGGLGGSGRRADEISALSVTSTSGTLCVLDGAGRPLRPAVMYSDSRSAEEAALVQEAGCRLAASLGYSFKPSFALPKILWVKTHDPDVFDRAALFVSPTDFVIGWLTGRWGRTDQTNALKYGYDLLNETWPRFIESRLGIPLDRMPSVEMCGTRVGTVTDARAEELGLPGGLPVAAGLTDGCASQISSGAVAPGDFNTTIGTTLVIKGVSEKLLLDPKGRIYCHRHPGGWWLPGGASNTGAECLEKEFTPREVERMSTAALSRSPTGVTAYPLVGRGERFPFSCADTERFMLGRPVDREDLFAALLEGVACLERLAYEMLEGLGAQVGGRIFSAGGGARSEAWLQIRADTLDRTVLRPALSGGAMGAAIVAASMDVFDTLEQAARSMVKMDMEKSPRPDCAARYREKFGLFADECRRRGYLG